MSECFLTQNFQPISFLDFHQI